jgi:general stress protein 26
MYFMNMVDGNFSSGYVMVREERRTGHTVTWSDTAAVDKVRSQKKVSFNRVSE